MMTRRCGRSWLIFWQDGSCGRNFGVLPWGYSFELLSIFYTCPYKSISRSTLLDCSSVNDHHVRLLLERRHSRVWSFPHFLCCVTVGWLNWKLMGGHVWWRFFTWSENSLSASSTGSRNVRSPAFVRLELLLSQRDLFGVILGSKSMLTWIFERRVTTFDRNWFTRRIISSLTDPTCRPAIFLTRPTARARALDIQKLASLRLHLGIILTILSHLLIPWNEISVLVLACCRLSHHGPLITLCWSHMLAICLVT